MSKVQLQGNASGTGIFTIASPNSNTDRTLTLPDNTGTLLSNASTLSRSQLPAGTVLQCQTTTAAAFNTTANTAQATGLSLSITPTSVSSKIIVQVSWDPYITSANVEMTGYLFKDGSNVYTYFFDGFNNNGSLIYSSTVSYFESPATTSAITFSTYLKSNGTTTIYTNGSSQNQRMIIWEIAG